MFTLSDPADIRRYLIESGSPKKAEHSMRFFKCGPGQYGEGDRFLGLTNPFVRSVVKKITAPYKTLNAEIIRTAEELMRDPFHEIRLTGILILVHFARRKKCTTEELELIYKSYIKNIQFINNWDLIDLSAEHITGARLFKRDRKILYKWILSPSLWVRRIALLSCLYFIKNYDYSDILKLSESVLNDKEDLIHKAAGWMLRETGKRDTDVLRFFLSEHAASMPRTMLRYAIERLPEKERKYWMLRKSLSRKKDF